MNCLNCQLKTNNPKYCSNICQKLFEQKLRIHDIESDKQIYWKQIKRYLTESKNFCDICKIHPIWNNKPLKLECDHIDGDISNNCLSNARLLCPNCHSQTDTYRARNKDNVLGKEHRKMRYMKSLK